LGSSLVADCNEKIVTMEIFKTQASHAYRSDVVHSMLEIVLDVFEVVKGVRCIGLCTLETVEVCAGGAGSRALCL
jgi:hypothetical protein